jgi:hypothetical protein
MRQQGRQLHTKEASEFDIAIWSMETKGRDCSKKRGRESLFRKGWCKVVKSIDTFGCGCKQAKHYERSDKTGLMIRGGFVYY